MNGGHPCVPPVSGDTTRDFMSPLRCFILKACAALGLPLVALPCQDAECPKVTHLGCTGAARAGESLTRPTVGVFISVMWRKTKQAQDLASSPHRSLFKNLRGVFFCAGDPDTQSAFVQKHVESRTKAQTIQNAIWLAPEMVMRFWVCHLALTPEKASGFEFHDVEQKPSSRDLGKCC